MAALAQSAQAKIVYTATNTKIENSTVPLDLNNDGTNDFSFVQFAYNGGQWQHFYIDALAQGNSILHDFEKGHAGAGALRPGMPIGPHRPFVADQDILANCGSISGTRFITSGNWNDVHNRYLGLRFSINGETHYAWARLTVTGKGGIGATLTGYAYETVPNRPIVAGQTSGTYSAGSDDDDGDNVRASIPPAATTLGALALGAAKK